MQLPKTYKGFLVMLIRIAEHGNDYEYAKKMDLSVAEQMEFGCVIAEIQNWLGENEELLDKFGLEFNGGL